MQQNTFGPGEWHTQTPLGFGHTNESLNLGQTTRRYNNQQQQKKKKNRIRKTVEFAVPADNWVKLKESEKKDESLYLARKLKKLWNMKLIIILIAVGALGTVTEGLLKGLEDLEIKVRDHPNNCIIEIDQYTEKSHGDLRKLAVTQTPVLPCQQGL